MVGSLVLYNAGSRNIVLERTTWEGESRVPEEVPPQAPSQTRPIAGEYGGPSSLTSGRDFHGSGGKEHREDRATWPNGGRVPRLAKDLGEDAHFGLASRADPAPEGS